MHVAERALHAQSVGAQSFQLSSAGHERHLVTSLSQPGAEVAAHGARGHHSDPHEAFLSFAMLGSNAGA